MTAEDIQTSGATNLAELARNIPGLYITDLGPGQSQVAIRGISAGQVVRDQAGVKESVGIYLDESPVSVALFTPDLELYDLDRVEVLRGPAGHAVRRGVLLGNAALHHRATQCRGIRRIDRGHAQRRRRQRSRAADCAPSSTCPWVRPPRCGWWRITPSSPGSSTLTIPGRGVIEDVNSGQRTGARVAFRFEPTENVTITPRVVYQKLETEGYPRVDVYNILGNTLTTTEPQVDAGERGQVTQFREGIDDDFLLVDLKLDFSSRHTLGLTSISSYTDREVVVLRDASQLTGSVTIDLGGTARRRAPELAAVRQHGSQGVQPGITAGLDGRRSVPVAGRRVLSAIRSSIRPEPADAGLRRIDPGAGRRGQQRFQLAARHAVLLRPELRLQAIRRVR